MKLINSAPIYSSSVSGIKLREEEIQTQSLCVRKGISGRQTTSYHAEERKVRFSNMVEVQEVHHFHSLTPGEIEDLFWSKRELQNIRKRCFVIVARTSQKGSEMIDKLESTARGLEYRFPDGYRKRRDNKRAALECVLREQYYQNQATAQDPENMALLYASSSRHCLSEARKIALQDALDAQEYCFWEQETKEERR